MSGRAVSARGAAYAVLWVWVGVASGYDLALTVAAGPHLCELNPVGRFWLRRGGPAALVFAKVAGTVLALGGLAWLWQARRPLAWAACVGCAAAQAAVLAFVLWA